MAANPGMIPNASEATRPFDAVGTTLNGLRGSMNKGPVLKHGDPYKHPNVVLVAGQDAQQIVP
jgi:hypothetical protein